MDLEGGVDGGGIDGWRWFTLYGLYSKTNSGFGPTVSLLDLL